MSPYHNHPSATSVTTQPPEFIKHVKNIGRAYLKQATELIACYRQQIPASKGRGHRIAVLRRVSWFIDKTLGYAAHASKEASEEVNKRFDEAARELDRYEEMFDPDNRTVIRRMEEAKEKDMTSLAALAELKEKRTDDWSAPLNVIPRMRVARNGCQPIETCFVIDTRRSTFSEIVWRPTHLRDRGRITPGGHPFFYRLSISMTNYDNEFKLYPVEDFQAVFDHNIYFLVDNPGRVFIKSQTKKLTFGNVWMPKHTLIFKDTFRTLVGERAAGLDPQVNPNVRFWDPVDSSRAKVFPPSLAGVASATRNDQLDIAAGPNINHSTIATESVANQKELVPRTWRFRVPNVYTSTKRTPTFDKDRVSSPQLPAANNSRHTTLSTINDDVLLCIFRSYRLDDEEKWTRRRRWRKLIRVCKRWLHLIYGFPFHLGIHLVCTNGTPVANMLKHSPLLPLIIDYRNTCITTEDEEGILYALQHHDHVRRIVLHAPPRVLQKFLTAMNKNFPTLRRLSIVSTSGVDPRLVMPSAFQAAQLSRLTLLGVTLLGVNLSAEPRSLSPAVSLVSLSLTNLRASPNPPPEDLAAQLQFVLSLKELSIRFSVPIPHSRVQIGRIRSSRTLISLPVLMPSISKTISDYLEGLLARTSAPSLRKFDVTLFDQFISALPVISKLIDATAAFSFPVTKIHFNRDCFSIFMSDNREEEAHGNRSLHVQVSCKPFDRQVSSAAQVCHKLWWTAVVEKLAIDGYEHAECRNEVDRKTWCELLRSFKSVKKLLVGRALTSVLSRVLQPAEPAAEEQRGTGGGVPVMPPLLFLQELVLEEGCDHNAFTAFIDARQRVGRPVKLVIRPFGREPGAGAKANASSQLPQQGGSNSSQPMPMPLKLRIPASSLMSQSEPSTPTRNRNQFAHARL